MEAQKWCAKGRFGENMVKKNEQGLRKGKAADRRVQ